MHLHLQQAGGCSGSCWCTAFAGPTALAAAGRGKRTSLRRGRRRCRARTLLDAAMDSGSAWPAGLTVCPAVKTLVVAARRLGGSGLRWTGAALAALAVALLVVLVCGVSRSWQTFAGPLEYPSYLVRSEHAVFCDGACSGCVFRDARACLPRRWGRELPTPRAGVKGASRGTRRQTYARASAAQPSYRRRRPSCSAGGGRATAGRATCTRAGLRPRTRPSAWPRRTSSSCGKWEIRLILSSRTSLSVPPTTGPAWQRAKDQGKL